MTAQAPVIIVARLLLAILFISAGVSKFGGLDGTAAYIGSAGLPAPTLLAPLVAGFEVLAGLALVLGWQARWAALALAGFTVVASVLFHAFWAVPAEQAMMQQLMFMKNLAVVGGLLLVYGFGAGPVSFDARRVQAA